MVKTYLARRRDMLYMIDDSHRNRPKRVNILEAAMNHKKPTFSLGALCRRESLRQQYFVVGYVLDMCYRKRRSRTASHGYNSVSSHIELFTQ